VSETAYLTDRGKKTFRAWRADKMDMFFPESVPPQLRVEGVSLCAALVENCVGRVRELF
jgi:hypothetical protein